MFLCLDEPALLRRVSKNIFLKFPEIDQFSKETHLEFLVISENFQPAASHIFCNRFNFRLPKFNGKREHPS